jgi:hypothetical protein
VFPPARVEFRIRDRFPQQHLLFVRDAGSGRTIPVFLSLGSCAGQWTASLHKAEEFWRLPGESWILCADGHRPGRLKRTDFVQMDARLQITGEESGQELQVVDPWRADLRLERGFGLPILFKDGEDGCAAQDWMLGPPLAGVAVFADGVRVAVSDEGGLALVSLEREPARLEFARAGWLVAADELEDGVRHVLMVRR